MEPNLPDGCVPDVHATDANAVGPDRQAPTLELVLESTTREFSEFYRSSRNSVGRALALTLHDADLASDAIDEAMARAFQRWARVGQLDNPGGWVYRVGLNYARSRVRRLSRKPVPTRDFVESALIEPAVMRALADLPVDHRAVVVCRLLLGWSEAETAASLHIRPGTAKSRLHRALAALESTLEHLRPEDPR
jgi:RNA polymerase sigma factor (sigma-70 family)